MSVDLKALHDEIDPFFYPRGVAVIGASRKDKKVGHTVLKSLIDGGEFPRPGLRGFDGGIYPVNPGEKEILGLACYPSVLDAPGPVDVAVFCVPGPAVAGAMKECGRKGVKGAVILTAGFGEAGESGKKLQEEFMVVAREYGIRVIGPNCLGSLYPPGNLNASFGITLPFSGPVALFSQSGALVDCIIDWSIDEKYGFSAVVSYGNKADLDVPDFLAWAAHNDYTRAIALYIEGVSDGRRFLEVASEVSKIKPIVALKAGRSAKGTKAVSSHTGSLSGSYAVYRGVFSQAGVILADNLTELLSISRALAHQPLMKGRRVAIVTNGGACGVMCTDYCQEVGLELPDPSPECIKRLDGTGLLHPAWSRGNPFDIVGDAGPDRYRAVLEEVMSSDRYDGVIVIQTLQAVTDNLGDARAVVETARKYAKPTLAAFMGGMISAEGIQYLADHDIPNFFDVKAAAYTMKALADYGEYRLRA
ncbi:MAG TPA: CoA-binding protein [bacterium]|nr:CoA-binding protein [bacterium]HPJ71245.1 CoA-binding protein [bacterium]HPQ65830.1 CoA-binding protein [bacterium]